MKIEMDMKIKYHRWMIINVKSLKFKTKSGNIIMNHFQDQTKKKPLIQYQKMKYNQPTVAIKDKIKKDKSAEKQNIYEPQTKKFKDYNTTKYTSQYQTQSNMQIFKKPNPTSQQIPLTPSNMEIANQNLNKNLTFEIVKNNQKNYMTQIKTQPEIQQPNPIISVNVNIKNMQPNTIEFKKPPTKYEVKPSNFKKNPLQRPHQTSMANGLLQNNTLKIDDEKRRFNNTTLNTTDRFIERPSMIDRPHNQRNEKKFKKQFQQKYIMTTSPTVDKDFMCDEELDIKPVDKKPLLYEKKLIEKKLPTMLQLPQSSQLTNTVAQGPMISQPATLMPQQRYVKKPQKPDRKMLEKELKQFEAQQEGINSIECADSINVLFRQQENYMVDPSYLEKTQKSVTWSVRAILLDWMRQLSHEYSLKRDTYHLAVVLLDNFMAKKPNIQKQVTQVIGATTMFIASKLQELECRPSQNFALSTQGICTAKDIQALEIEICKTLQFKLNPPTICSLANRIMSQWDKYIDEVDYAMHHPCFDNCQKPYFKKFDTNSYKIFRQLMQFIDCVILDIQTAQYKPILIVLSLMYLIIGMRVTGFQADEIHQVFPRGSHYLLDQTNYFNNLFENFVESTFGMTLLQILPSIQYTATYFNLTLTYEKPVLDQSGEGLEQMVLEEYCTYQTYNRHMLKTVTSRFRGIMNTF